jgi:Amt family ammonium transporter
MIDFLRRPGTASGIALAAILLAASPAFTQDMEPASDATRFILNSALFIAAGLGGLLFVAAFGLRDVGLARIQNAPAVSLRTIGLMAVTAFAFWLTGFNLIHSVEEGGLIGEFSPWRFDDADPMSAGKASGAFWFFHMAAAGIPSAIVASAISERVRLFAFLILALAMGGLIYPVAASWVWSNGYFAAVWRFHDFGGAAAIHMTGGAAALAAAIVVGPRPGLFQDGGQRVTPTTTLPLSVFAAGLMLIGWFVVLAGAAGSLDTVESAIRLGAITVNTTLGAMGGAIAAIFLTQIVYRRPGLVSASTAAIGGAVALAAEPLYPALWQALMIGAVGGVVVTVTPPFIARYGIDDAGVVTPAHLLCGAWGVIIAPWCNPDAWFLGQIVGAAAIFVWSFVMTLLIATALKFSFGLRLRASGEQAAGAERGGANS